MVRVAGSNAVHKERGKDMKSNWEHSHSGVFARDLEKTVRYYQSLGLAPQLIPTQNPSLRTGKAVNIEFGQVVNNYSDPTKPFLQLIYIGNLELEVLSAPAVRPEGEALAYCEGINHVCFNVPDIDVETDKLVKKGLRIIQDFKLDGVRLEDYLDTREFGNILLSLRTPQTEGIKKIKAGYGIVNWKFYGHSAVVRDVDKTAGYYRSRGIAEIQAQAMFDSSDIENVRVYGKSPKNRITAKTRVFQIGPVAYELIQPLEGDSIFKESLGRRGEGIIDLIFTVDNLDRETAKLVEKGVPVVFSGKHRGSNAFAFFDTRQHGGDVMIKLVQR
jgi:catechol 2,3-dioxygenase-like lactoylglutathione lyase family enzyme